MATSDPDSRRHDEISARVKVAESEVVQIAKVRLRVFDFRHFVIVLYDGVEHLLKHVIGLRVTGKDTTAAVQVLTAYILVNVKFSKIYISPLRESARFKFPSSKPVYIGFASAGNRLSLGELESC